MFGRKESFSQKDRFRFLDYLLSNSFFLFFFFHLKKIIWPPSSIFFSSSSFPCVYLYISFLFFWPFGSMSIFFLNHSLFLSVSLSTYLCSRIWFFFLYDRYCLPCYLYVYVLFSPLSPPTHPPSLFR